MKGKERKGREGKGREGKGRERDQTIKLGHTCMVHCLVEEVLEYLQTSEQPDQQEEDQ
jgi:hypothetical protein